MTAPASAPPSQQAAPVARRPGPSGGTRWRWRPGTLTGLLVLACLSLMLLDLRGGPTDALRAAGSWVGGPLEAAAAGVTGSVGSALRRPDVEALEDRITALDRENTDLRLRVDALTEQLAGAADAAAVERLTTSLDQAAVAAQVVAGGTQPTSATVTVDAGSTAGVRDGSAVLVPGGLVGRVVAVGPTTSTVQLVTDPASAVAVRIQSSRQAALAQGAGRSETLDLDYVDPLAAVRVGDRLVTMGSPGGRPFPAGIPVASVASVTGSMGDVDRAVTATPAVDLGALDHVAILTGEAGPGSEAPEGTP